MSVVCAACDQEVSCPPIFPIKVRYRDDGTSYIPADFTQVYEHMRDEHPDIWTDVLAREFEDWKAGRV